MDLRVDFAPGGKHPDQTIGHLWQDRAGVVWFEYDSDWRAGARELSPVFLGNRASVGALTSPSRSFGELFGLFQDCLPDWWGERLMHKFFQSMGIPWRSVTTLQKLACQGRRKPGALVFHPDVEEADFHTATAMNVDELAGMASEVLTGHTSGLLDRLVTVSLSPGGAQPKASLAFNSDFTHAVAADLPPDGFTSWLVKFDVTPELMTGKTEYAYALMARAAGIEIPECRLLDGRNGACHFLSRRFDRGPAHTRLHVHTFSGLTHTPVSNPIDYADIIALARILVARQSAVDEIFRRAVFNIMAGNDDDHGRNHAFLMDFDGNWQLTPAYDLTPATNPLMSGIRAGSIDRKSIGITREDLLAFGVANGVQRPGNILDQVSDAISRWPVHASSAGLPDGRVDEIPKDYFHPGLIIG